MTRAEEMRRYEDKKGIGKRVADPETAKGGKGDGMKLAMKEPRKNAVEKGKPEKGKEPSLRSDGMKTAMKGEGKPGDKSKLTKMAAAEKKVR